MMDEFIESILHPSFFVGILFMLIGIVMYFLPPKKPNMFYGYRTPASMKSQERWTFSQRFSAVKMAQAGAVLFVISLCGYFIDADSRNAIGVLMLFICIAYLFITTERAIKNQFKN